MKILAIRGKNLASLEQEFEVDFTAEPLKSAGIFAITGRTGSGKSTLLDALCLALFDASPRITRAAENVAIQDAGDKMINQRDCRNLLRRGAADGFAEVDFVALNGNAFRARWAVRRARNKAGGSLQNSEMRLCDLSAGKETQGVKTEILARISELIGLTFEQFTRSVLLAQGDFATFLKARQSEKAELLEKLTGTDIYSRISVAIYEKAKDAEAEWNLINERINAIEILSDEQLGIMDAENCALKRELAALKSDGERLVAQLKWMNDDERLAGEIRLAEAQMAEAGNAVEAAAGRFDYIAQVDAVQDIRDTFGRMNDAARQLTAYRENLRSAGGRLAENARVLEDARRHLAECESEQEMLAEKQLEIAPQIIRARELDVRIKTAKAAGEEAQREFDGAKEAFDKMEEAIRTTGSALSQANRQVAALNEWFAANKKDEQIVARTELLLNLTADAQTAAVQAEQCRKTLAANRALLDDNRLRTERLLLEAKRLNSLLPAEIAALREALVEGDPCPVCGSTHHPAARLEDAQRMKEQELNEAKAMNVRLTERLTHDAERLRNEHTRLEALIENYSVQHGQACARLAELLADVPGWKKLFDGGGLKAFLTDKTKRWNSRTEELERLREEANRLQAHLENLHGRRADCAEAFTAKRERLAERLAVAADLLSERANILHGKPVDAVERYFADRRREVAEKLKAATDCRNRLSEKQESLNGAIRQINRNIEQTDGRRRGLLQEVDSWREAAGNISYDQLTDRLGRDNAWLQREKLALKALAEAETAAAATLAERRKNRELLHRAEGKPADADVTAALLKEWIAAKNAAIESGAKRLTDLGVALSTDARARAQRKSLAAALEGMSERAENWKKLNLLLGSASGNKFKEMAQGYTLETLLAYANKQLAELAPRYRLQRIPDTLALQVVDVDMLNEVRTVHSLSGGESFLVSLALALGLSSLSSNRMKVESLFIDEGFGSLDSETLRIAMDALGRLHTQGRKIGVISHVAEMTERISVRINVVRTSNGKSYIRITS